jgi:hypothetical protein
MLGCPVGPDMGEGGFEQWKLDLVEAAIAMGCRIIKIVPTSIGTCSLLLNHSCDRIYI